MGEESQMTDARDAWLEMDMAHAWGEYSELNGASSVILTEGNFGDVYEMAYRAAWAASAAAERERILARIEEVSDECAEKWQLSAATKSVIRNILAVARAVAEGRGE